MDYKLISLEKTVAHIQFAGKFDNKNIIWDAEIFTLKSLISKDSKSGIKQFIDLPEQHTNLKPISIALNVNTISIPEILKTIIMITNYKNLKTGKHEYGETHYF